ncbi:MAG: phosphoribosylanthranilate isomerase [Maricaulaceae bacterium]
MAAYKTPMRVRVKICCIASLEEARIAMDAGVDALGLVARMPSGPGPISDEAILAISSKIPPPISTFMLTSETTAERIAAHINVTQPTTVQIVSHIDLEESKRLAVLKPHIRRVQVIHVEDMSAVELIPVYAPYVHAFLLDSGKPNAQIPELGGTGRIHDWAISRAFVEASPLPVFLAGGLNPSNVGEAIASVKPFGIDLCSGVRTNGALDPSKLRNFMLAIEAGHSSIS